MKSSILLAFAFLISLVFCFEKDLFIGLNQSDNDVFMKSYKISLLKKHGNCYQVGLNKRILNMGEYKVIKQIDNSFCK